MTRFKNLLIFVSSALFIIVLFSFEKQAPLSTSTVLLSPLGSFESENILGSQTVQAQNPTIQNATLTPSIIQTPISILLLGLDGRKGQLGPRCDAIHILTLDPILQKLRITSIPRGTSLRYSGLDQDTIIANACHIYGVDFATSRIEKIAGVKIDYTVKVGFSQTMGVLRTLGLPTIPTLQFLRNRHLPLGDNQRSRNQAQFLKDQTIAHLDFFSRLPNPIKYIVYKMLDTDLDFELANALLLSLQAFNIQRDPTRIELVMKPVYLSRLKEQHAGADVLGDTTWENETEFQTYQSDLSTYIENLIIRAQFRMQTDLTSAHELVKTPFNQKIWLQIQEAYNRTQYEYDLLRIYVLTAPDREKETGKILDFMTEMEAMGNTPLKEKGGQLLSSVIS